MVYLAGSMATLVVIGVLLVAGSTAASSKPAHPSAVSALIDIALGVLLVVMGVRHIIEPPKPNKDQPAQAKPQAKIANKSLGAKVVEDAGMGVVLTVTDVTSLVFYASAAKTTADAKLPVTDQVLAMGIVALGVVTPIILPLLATLFAPKTSQRFLDGVNSLLKQYGRFIAAVVALLFGFYLLLKGGRVFS